MRTICIVVFLVLARVAVAQASYSAFDLAAGKLTIEGAPDGATVGTFFGSTGCDMKVDKGVLTIQRNDKPGCAAIFATHQPRDLGVDFVLPASAPAPGPGKPAAPKQVVVALPLSFDHGIAKLAKAELDEQSGTLDFHDKAIAGRVAYYAKGAWQVDVLQDGTIKLSVADLAKDAELYFQPANRKEVFVVAVYGKPAEPEPLPFEAYCQNELATVTSKQWLSKIDAANSLNALQIKMFPPIVEPNTFGVIVVRHLDNLQATFDGTGTVKIGAPIMRDNDLSLLDAIRSSGAGTPQPRKPKLVCTVYQVAPRAPGPFTVTVSLVDPTKTGNVSQRKVDVIVLQRYAGAFRAGVAGVFGAPDQKFEARTSPNSMQPEIARVSKTPVELVFGYSIYINTTPDVHGRSYFTRDGEAVQDSQWGVYLGFGAVSVASGSIDFLKSLHAGIEYEFSPYFAVALTGVLRRVDELASGAAVGGPASMTIPTQSTYVAGIGLVLNISPSFFKFALTVGR